MRGCSFRHHRQASPIPRRGAGDSRFRELCCYHRLEHGGSFLCALPLPAAYPAGRNRIRYILTTDKRFLIREGEGGVWFCEFRGKRPFRAPLSDLKDPGASLPEVIYEILFAATSPLDLTELTTLAAHATGVTDRTESIDELVEVLRDPAAPFAHSAELKDWLRSFVDRTLANCLCCIASPCS